MTDLDSSNGSFITSCDRQRVPIDPFVPNRVGHGTCLQIGDKNLRVEQDDGTDGR